MSQAKKTVMISSTARDLPEHRKEVMDACLRQGMFPAMMEHLPASDAEAISASLKMVDEADIYVGVFAHRYGYVPKGHDISVTEMEYNRAVERKIPRLIFVMGNDHPIKFEDVEVEAAAKLKAFKERVQTENIVNFFNSLADLRAHTINSLSHQRVPDLMVFHYVSDIPAPPAAYIAHPYTLLQTHRLVGRQAELKLLTDWVAKSESEVYAARILNVVAIGGMGKSALTWKWFNEIAPQEMKPLAGRMWWSFYESDARFENFVTRALAYTTRRPLDEVKQLPAHECEAQLLLALDREPFLIVLDGFERMLIAYARMDAAHLDNLDAPASSRAGVAEERMEAEELLGSGGLQATSAREDAGAPRLRKTADPRVGNFLRKLATTVRAARILVSTRLSLADLENKVNGDPLPGCFKCELRGLADADALELWQRFGVTGTRDMPLPIFQRIENHPLLIQSLAGEVARFRRAPGDFDRWRQANPDFNPFRDIPLVQVKSHVLEFALRGLDQRARQVLQILAAFRMPAQYDTLIALFTKNKRQPEKRGWLDSLTGRQKAPKITTEQELDAALAELEDRGLVGWDKRANRYDLHPIVRGVVWGGLDGDARRGVYTNLHSHFEAESKLDEYKVNCLEDLTPAIELYNILIGLGRQEDAAVLFRDRLSHLMLYRLCASRQRVELLEMLFPNKLDQPLGVSNPEAQSYLLNALGIGYDNDGQPGRAALMFCRSITIGSNATEYNNPDGALRNLSGALRLSGRLYESEAAAHKALHFSHQRGDRYREAITLYWLGLTLMVRGNASESNSVLQRSLRIFGALSDGQSEGLANFALAQWALWSMDYAAARSLANRAWELALNANKQADLISAARVQGAAALGLHDFAVADERLRQALTRARQVNFVEEELPVLIAVAEWRRQQGSADEAHAFLDDVWEPAERGPYPLFHADARNVLTTLERDAGNRDAAIAAATQAYRLSWCDGPPYAYHWGLVAAQKHLDELGAPVPDLPPFDPAMFEQMPEVEIDPEDKFHIGTQK